MRWKKVSSFRKLVWLPRKLGFSSFPLFFSSSYLFSRQPNKLSPILFFFLLCITYFFLVIPSLCILLVFFYLDFTMQDRDESRESLRKGLSIVSMLICDSVEFLYGDEREVDQSSKVLLELGDVLLFGGESQMVFHGVPSIVPFSTTELLK